MLVSQWCSIYDRGNSKSHFVLHLNQYVSSLKIQIQNNALNDKTDLAISYLLNTLKYSMTTCWSVNDVLHLWQRKFKITLCIALKPICIKPQNSNSKQCFKWNWSCNFLPNSLKYSMTTCWSVNDVPSVTE